MKERYLVPSVSSCLSVGSFPTDSCVSVWGLFLQTLVAWCEVFSYRLSCFSVRNNSRKT